MNKVKNIIKNEISLFNNIKYEGMKKMTALIKQYYRNTRRPSMEKEVLKIYQTYGFPLLWIQKKILSANIFISWKYFQLIKNNIYTQGHTASLKYYYICIKNFKCTIVHMNYFKTIHRNKVLFLLDNLYRPCVRLNFNTEGYIIMKRTIFYADAGGQDSDTGYVKTCAGIAFVSYIQNFNGVYFHKVHIIKGTLLLNYHCTCYINIKNRMNISINHSNTPLLHDTLRIILGKIVRQKGSKISGSKLRFDFYYPKDISAKTIKLIWNTLNVLISKNTRLYKIHTNKDNAKKYYALSLFQEKYKYNITMIQIGRYSLEYCGGAHINNTGQISAIVINYIKNLSNDIYRIELRTYSNN